MPNNKRPSFTSLHKTTKIVPPPPNMKELIKIVPINSNITPVLQEITKTLTSIQETSKSIKNLLNRDTPLKKGDIIGVSRGWFEHYGVYVGENKVIHYTSIDSDISLNNKIMETDFLHFLKDSRSFFILNCEYPQLAVKSQPIYYQGFFSNNELISFLQKQKVYSPEETVRRARSRIGEDQYSLLINNCEHFAIWCKTGISKSHQVDSFLKLLTPVIVQI